MKQKKKAKDRRSANKIDWRKKNDDKVTPVDGGGVGCDGVIDGFDLTDEMVRQYEAGEIDELPEMSISFTPRKINKQEFMESLKEIRHEDLESMSAASNAINLHLRENKEIFFEVLNYSADLGNFFSMKQLAEYYRNEEHPRESEPGYLYWLNKIASDPLVVKFIEFKEQDKYIEELSILSNEYLGFIAGSVFFELGLYYRNSDILAELNDALSYISYAEQCGYPSYPGPYVTHEIEVELIEKIRRLVKYEATRQIENDLIDLIKDISIEQLTVDEQISEFRKRIRAETGEEIWSAFQEETRICLVTSISCFYYLLHARENEEKLDFSCVIVPLMKTLEHELRIRFYNGYIEFLKNEYQSVNRFLETNNIMEWQKECDRGGIIYVNRNGKYFSDYERYPNKYTLGSFIYSTGLLSLKRGMNEKGKTADQTMIEYCQERLLRHKLKNNDEVDSWLYELATHIDKIKDDRNESAHGGNIKNAFSANEALNYLVLIKKVLVDLIRDCN